FEIGGPFVFHPVARSADPSNQGRSRDHITVSSSAASAAGCRAHAFFESGHSGTPRGVPGGSAGDHPHLSWVWFHADAKTVAAAPAHPTGKILLAPQHASDFCLRRKPPPGRNPGPHSGPA